MGDDDLQGKGEHKHSQQQFVAEKTVEKNGAAGEVAAVEGVEELEDDKKGEENCRNLFGCGRNEAGRLKRLREDDEGNEKTVDEDARQHLR